MRTLSRIVGACALSIALWVIALQDAAAALQPARTGRTILVFGDSLSAAYQLKPEQGWVALLNERLRTQGYGYNVVNASISGETTAGGLQRLPRALELNKPQILVLELGANDALRGLPLTTAKDNLSKMVELATKAGAKVLLVGMRIPPNYGPKYTADFVQMYADVSAQYHTPLVPFLLQSVALDSARMQDDGLHPNASGEPAVLDTLWPQLVPLLKKEH